MTLTCLTCIPTLDVFLILFLFDTFLQSPNFVTGGNSSSGSVTGNASPSVIQISVVSPICGLGMEWNSVKRICTKSSHFPFMTVRGTAISTAGSANDKSTVNDPFKGLSSEVSTEDLGDWDMIDSNCGIGYGSNPTNKRCYLINVSNNQSSANNVTGTGARPGGSSVVPNVGAAVVAPVPVGGTSVPAG